MLAVVAMCIQFRSYLRGARFTLRTDHKSLVWLHRFKDTEGMLSRWLHSLQQFQFSIIHRPGRDHGNADGLSRAPSSPCRQCTRPDCPPAALTHHDSDQPFDSVSTGSSEDADLVPVQSGEDWIARLDNDLSRPVETSGDSFRISALQKEDPVCVTLHDWVLADEFPAWAEVKSMLPELRSLWHHRNLCIASSSLLLVLDPLPMDRISRHTVEEISLWPVADRHAILAVANRDVRVARQNIAELMLYVDDHAAHLANCASANDDSLTLMSAELLPRLEGGIRAVLDEADNM